MAMSNPAGWIVIGLAILGGIISLIKSVWGFFDNDYRAGQQRNTTNSKISEIKGSLRQEIEKKLPEIDQSLTRAIDETKEMLLAEKKDFDDLIDTFENAKNEFDKLSLNIQNKNN